MTSKKPDTGEELEGTSEPFTGGPEAFTEFLALFKDGHVDVEMTAALAELVTAVQTLRKPGTVTLTFKIAPWSSDTIVIDGEKILTATEKIVTKLPEEPRPPALLYGDASGGLSKNPPSRQLPGVAQ